MKIKIALFVVLASCFQLLKAQDNNSIRSFLIKGKVDNHTETSWRFYMTDFFNGDDFTVVIKNDGTFNKVIPVEGMQNITLNLNDGGITVFVQPEDTLEIYWDEKDFKRTFKVKSPRPDRNTEIQLNLAFYKEFKQADSLLLENIYNQKDAADSVKFRWINDLYNQELKFVLDSTRINNVTDKFVDEIFYKKMNQFFWQKCSLITDHKLINPGNSPFIKKYLPEKSKIEYLSTTSFYKSPEYRDFLFNYIRFGKRPFNGTMPDFKACYVPGPGGDSVAKVEPFMLTRYYAKIERTLNSGFAFEDYYTGMGNIYSLVIRDWFITNAIFFAFNHYDFEEAESVLHDFLPKCKMQVYKDTLTAYYSYAKKFRKGSPAPDFTLYDEQGKKVSLSDFRGKVVFIDFWGVGCGPCRSDIKKFIPALHQKYLDKEVVFINICNDANEKEWKKAIADLKLDGINLLAQGRSHDPVCEEYNINAVPHYILIDKNGNFSEYNAERAEELMKNNYKEIDELLQAD